MEITFEKVGNSYVAEFEATADFNLHIERIGQGTLEVHQRGTAEGKYDFAWSAGVGARKVIDYDFGALVYPKYIKVVSGSEVLSASVNFNEGGGSGSGSGEASTCSYYHIIDSFLGKDATYGDDIYVYSITNNNMKVLDTDTNRSINADLFFFDFMDAHEGKYIITDVMFVHGHYVIKDDQGISRVKYYDSFEEYLKQRAKRRGITINPSDHVKSISYDEYWEGIDKTYTFPTDDSVPS